jgi:hypothetical protein
MQVDMANSFLESSHSACDCGNGPDICIGRTTVNVYF